MEAYSLKVTGKVQGVFFRKFSKLRADELNVHGWVKNLDDGSVSIDVEGEKQQVNSFVQWCHFGPEKAAVEHVEVNERIPVGYRGFEIRS